MHARDTLRARSPRSWCQTRGAIAHHLASISRLAQARRLGEVQGRIAIVDRVAASADGPPDALDCAIAPFDGGALEVLVPSGVRISEAIVHPLLRDLRELHALTPAHDARLVVARGSVRYHCVGASDWFSWAGWEGLLEAATRGPGIVTHAGAWAEVTPLRGPDDALLLVVHRASPPRPDPLGPLSPSQRAVVEYAAVGATLPEIARARDCALETVRSQLKEAYRRLGVGSRAELASLVARSDPERGSSTRERVAVEP